jgi:hypothetical protein
LPLDDHEAIADMLVAKAVPIATLTGG